MRLSKTALNRISAILIPLLIIAFIAVGYRLIKDEKADSKTVDVSNAQIPSESSDSDAATSSDSSSKSSSAADESDVQSSAPSQPISDGSFADALFIGDSRTEGLRLYGNMTGAVFFSNKGMSINNVQKEVLSVYGIGEVNLSGVLSARQYGKIYIMLGINEIGSKLETNAQNYNALIEYIQSVQPKAKVIIEANLHVSAEKSSVPGTVFNNQRIDSYNNLLASLADGKKVFYINANVLFDDNMGNLRSECTSDGIHIYAKHYSEWAQWLLQN